MNFVNLKNHTDYSILEGVSKVEDYIKKAKELKCQSIGLTDKNLYAAMKMYRLCLKENIDFVLGLELYVYGLKKEGNFAITVFAKGYEGYKELIKLNSLKNAKYKEKIEIIDINEIVNCKNIVVICGGINSELYSAIDKLEYSIANDLATYYKKSFSDFYLELPAFIMPKRNIDEYVLLAKELELPLVVTNDTYYTEKEDFELQKVVTAIREKTDINKITNYYKEKDLYFKSIEDILQNENFKDIENLEEYIENTNKIAQKCKFTYDLSIKKMPDLNLDISEKEYLKAKVFEGLKEKYENVTEEIEKRAEYELSVIDEMGFNAYFIIVYDIIKYARSNDILVGPGRGSAAGSLVSYALDITRIDPIKYGLIFERFLNKGRKNLPDIDMDFETERKQDAINYVISKYGDLHVAKIRTFSKFKTAQLKQDLERIKLARYNKGLIKKAYDKLINNANYKSVHASGIIISRDELTNSVPIYFDKNNEGNIAEYQMEDLEAMGLLKIDFLSLLNLDILKAVSKTVNVRLEDIPLDDKNTFDLYNKLELNGIFQVESEGIKKLIKNFKINNLSDISTVLSFYRPGPLESGLTNSIINRKNKKEKIEYIFDELEDILKDSYGVIIYQEQIMRIAKEIAGFDLNESDYLRRAISKKNPEILAKYEQEFITRAVNRSYDEKKVRKLYDEIKKFGGYGFNKSHSISYSLVSYYTAYFKANYKKEYLCTLLNIQHGKEKMYECINDMDKNNISLLGPDVNKSNYYFEVLDDSIRYSLYSIKNISNVMAFNIVKERNENKEFKDVLDFTYRMQKYQLKEEHLKSLAKAGAFDSFSLSRKEIVNYSKEFISLAKKMTEEELNIGKKLFFTTDSEVIEYRAKNIEEYTKKEKLDYEMDMLSYPLSIDKQIYHRLKYSKYLKISDTKALYNGKLIDFANDNIKKYTFFVVRGKKIYDLSKLFLYKNIVTHILLDEVSKENRESLKDIIKQNPGLSEVRFYENAKRLVSKKKVYLSLKADNIKRIISLIGDNNISISIEI